LINPTPQDFLIIDKIPDIFVTGHIHKSKVGRYRNILNLNCGCFQDKTSFQEKVGHEPEPGRVPIVNLQTSEVKMMRFK
jgi:DNA polymerase II small subunit